MSYSLTGSGKRCLDNRKSARKYPGLIRDLRAHKERVEGVDRCSSLYIPYILKFHSTLIFSSLANELGQ